MNNQNITKQELESVVKNAIESNLMSISNEIRKGKSKERLYTINEVCDLINVSRATLYQYMNKGILPWREKNGLRGRRFTKQDVEAMYSYVNSDNINKVASKMNGGRS